MKTWEQRLVSRRSALASAATVASALMLAGCAGDSSASGGSGSSSQAGSSSASTSSGSATGGTWETAPDGGTIDDVDASDAYATGTHHATIEVEGRGTIEVELDADSAPITVSNFAHLAEQGFFDGLTFHRIIRDFMVQGGDPNGDGTGGSSRTIKGEFSANGVSNALVHTRGAISMARSQAFDSGSSQFFIMQKAQASLDGQYAAFGHVTSGIEVVDALCETTVEDDNGTVAAQNQPRIARVTMVD